MAIDYEAHRPHPTLYKGVMFRSRLEAKWAALFDLMEWAWQYEPFDLGRWSPDFLIKGRTRDALVEVKPIGAFDEEARNVARRMMRASHGQYHLILCGVMPMVENEILVTLHTHCGRCDHPRGECGWASREIMGLSGAYDLVFGHGPVYSGFISGIDADEEPGGDSFMGREVMDLWAKAGNLTQWRAPRTD